MTILGPMQLVYGLATIPIIIVHGYQLCAYMLALGTCGDYQTTVFIVTIMVIGSKLIVIKTIICL